MNDSAHWLEGVLQKAGKTVGAVGLPSTLPLDEAWERASEASGVLQSDLADLVAAFFQLPRASLDEVEGKALRLVPEALAHEYQILPLKEEYRRMVVATADPTNLEAEQAIGFASGRGISLVVASHQELQEAIHSQYSPDKDVARILFQVQPDLDDSLDDIRLIEDEDEAAPSLEEAGSGPLVNLTNVILKEAVEAGASDIHLQPMAHGGVIRYRIDGVLRNSGNMPLSVLTRVVSRIKIMAKLDIADRLRPQDGRAKVGFGDRHVDLRISTVPTRNAEKMVIRILDSEEAKGLEEVGFLEPELSHFRHLLSHREGIVVVTGPTGSGKTTTLYAALQAIHDENINIMTVEDPVEYELPGLTQIQVETKQGVTFAAALRAILRQDPDVVFVGEIRDLETAQIAAQASLTGHLVLSTLHTNDAVGTVGRFADMGLDRPTLAETLRGALAQRLVRRICPLCCEPVKGDLTESEAELAKEYGVSPTVRPVGCRGCGQSGFRGRIPLVEVLPVTPKIKELIFSGGSSAELERTARAEGVRSLRDVGVARVKAGETTLQELERVLGDVGGRSEAAGAATGKASAGSQAGPSAPPAVGVEEEDHLPPPILIVDDDGANRTIAKALLESEGHRVEEAKDGAEAIELVQSGRAFSLMVLDLEMPKMDGRQVLKEVRGSMATVGLPVIVLTGTTEPDAELTLLEEGADDYIRKPFDPRRFMIRVKAALRRAGV